MRRTTTVVTLVVLAGLIYGCQPPAATDSHSKDTATTAATEGGTNSNVDTFQPAGKSHRDVAVETVSRFLTALKSGDHVTATEMLSAKARQETAKLNLGISPPGSSSAKFVVDREGVFQGEDGNTYVLSTWTDTDARGVRQTYDIGWILKKENSSLAITGMVTKVFDDSSELLLNFEDPADMMRRRSEAEAEIARRHQRQQENVAQESSGQPVVR